MTTIEIKPARDNAMSRHQRYTYEVHKTYANGYSTYSSYRSKAAATRAANLMREYEA